MDGHRVFAVRMWARTRYVQLMRAKDGRQPMFQLHENGTKYV